jgi:hypothetical protein
MAQTKEGKVVSVTDYAKMRGVSRQYIFKLIWKGKPLTGVSSYFKAGATYILILE